MKTTIYELLGMIKDGKAPKKIMYKTREFELANDNEYYRIDEDMGLFEYLFSEYTTDNILNIEVKILETTITYKQDDKIEKLNIELNADDENKVNWYRAKNLECELAMKINEIIDHLNNK